MQALLGRLGDKKFLDSTVEGWLAPVAAAMVEAGDSEATARTDARLGMAVVRGLLLDLLATGDRDGRLLVSRLADLGYTQEATAARAGVSVKTVQRDLARRAGLTTS